MDVLPASFTFLTLGGSVLSGDFKVDMNTYLSRKPALLSCCKARSWQGAWKLRMSLTERRFFCKMRQALIPGQAWYQALSFG